MAIWTRCSVPPRHRRNGVAGVQRGALSHQYLWRDRLNRWPVLSRPWDTCRRDAVAVAGNVTIVGQTQGGYLSITTLSTTTPTTSTINFPLGDTRANNTLDALDGAGRLWAIFKAPAGRGPTSSWTWPATFADERVAQRLTNRSAPGSTSRSLRSSSSALKPARS